MWKFSANSVTMHDMHLDGWYTNGGVHSVPLQHGHAIDLRGAAANLHHLDIKEFAGDCVYFGLAGSPGVRSSGTFNTSYCGDTGRNGVSVVAGNNVTLGANIGTYDIGYVAFDVEPNAASLGNFGASNVLISGNTIGAYQITPFSVIGLAPVSDVTFSNNTLNAAATKGFRPRVSKCVPMDACLTDGIPDYRPQRIYINDNTAVLPAAEPGVHIMDTDTFQVMNNRIPMVSGRAVRTDRSDNGTVSGNS
jgi:hypothetical protein